MRLISVRWNWVLLLAIMANVSVKGQNSSFTEYPIWENTTVYSKTYVVDKRHPNADDKNEGTKDAPFKTINKAAQLVKAGEQVVVYGGVYRELVQPKHGGTATDNMISYKVAPGEDVIIKGSVVLTSPWKQDMILTDKIDDANTTYEWSRKVWMTKVSSSFFKNYNPLKLKNIEDHEHELMPWAVLCKGRAPFELPRALLFQDNKRMKQVVNYSDLSLIPGSYWVGNDGVEVHIHPFNSKNPNNSLFEITTTPNLFKPQTVGLSYIQVEGFRMMQCGNGFLRTSTGALCVNGGHHWIIENNEISSVNSSGIEFGYYAYEFEDKRTENIQSRKDEDLGNIIIRNNKIFECGTAGMRSYSVLEGRILNNEIFNCGWQDAENYWECGGIKLLRTNHTLLKGNKIHDITGGNGIWLDWDNRYSRVTQNVIYNTQAIQGGIFVEASREPNLLDNNILWNIDANGIYGNDSDELLVYHNIIANVTGDIVHAVTASDRMLYGREMSSENNQVKNNIFINVSNDVKLESSSSENSNNLYVTSSGFASIIPTKNEGLAIYGKCSFNPETGVFMLVTNFELPIYNNLEIIGYDWFGESLPKNVKPGPFQNLSNNTLILLNE